MSVGLRCFHQRDSILSYINCKKSMLLRKQKVEGRIVIEIGIKSLYLEYYIKV
jgi:hypothetical protein